METNVEQTLHQAGFDTVDLTQNHEPSGETVLEPKTSFTEKVQRVAKGVFERHGVIFKRGGGRPRKDGLPNKLDIPLNAPATALPVGAKPEPATGDPAFDSALVKKCCTAVIKAWRGFADRILFRKAQRAGYEKLEAQQLVNDTTITQEEADSFAELAEICLRKYGVGTAYAPEIGLAAIVLGVGVRYTTAVSTLNEKIEQDAKLRVINGGQSGN